MVGGEECGVIGRVLPPIKALTQSNKELSNQFSHDTK